MGPTAVIRGTEAQSSSHWRAGVLVRRIATDARRLQFNFPSNTSGSTPSIGTTSAGYTGAAEATCTNRAWGGLNASCNPNPCAGTASTFGSC